MPNTSSNENRRSIDFSNLIVNYSDGDILTYDHVKQFSEVLPLKPMANLIAVCVSGSMKVSVNGTDIEVKADDVFFSASNGRIGQFEQSDDFEMRVLCLSDPIVHALIYDKIDVWNQAVYVNHQYAFSMSHACKEEIAYYYALIRSKVYNDDRMVPQEVMHALLRSLLLELCYVLESTHSEFSSEKLSQGKVIFNRFLSLISSTNMKRQPIAYYADQLAITSKYLTMLCQKYSDKTASEWVIQYTLEDIRFYLRNSNLSIKEISAKMGFSNMSHFGSYVRKHMGMSPSSIRHM